MISPSYPPGGNAFFQGLDYYPAAAYLDLGAPAFCPRPEGAAAWVALARASLLEGDGMTATLLKEMEGRRDIKRCDLVLWHLRD